MFFPTAQFRNEERARYIAKQKCRRELERQQEERTNAAMKAAEKTPYEKTLDELEAFQRHINSIREGDPRNEGHVINSLKQIGIILDFCLNEYRPGAGSGVNETEG